MDKNEMTLTDLTLDWDDAFGSQSIPEGAGIVSIPDALILSLSNLGRVDIDYIIDQTGESYSSVVDALKGSIYQNPERWEGDLYRGWETAEEYLSGNLRMKLSAARKANKLHNEKFKENVMAIKRLLPEQVTSQDIYVTLGSPWVPTEIIDDFIYHIFNMKHWDRGRLYIRHDEYTGSWEINDKYALSRKFSVAAMSTYGTKRMDALDILERTLNMRTVAVYDEVESTSTRSGIKRVINHPETLLAVEKQQLLVNEFQKWVWQDEKRKQQLENIFDRKYGSVRRRVFDGSFLTFPGLSKDIQLHPYQKNAVARILFSPNTLLAHDVGSGKTYVMIVAGMELKRMGLSKKNLYVVPNNIVIQWKEFFDLMYPDAKVMCVDSKSFTPDKRGTTLRAIRDGDWDAVIMAYSCYERIPLSKDFLLQELKDAKDEIRAMEENKSKATSALRRRKEKIAKAAADLLVEVEINDGIPAFDDLGITRLFVDEAHNFKNVPIDTKVDRVLGISAGGSKKCQDMMDKVHYIQKQNLGGGVVMATGTPITNSLTDAYVMQSYLQSGELAMLDLQTFDSWIGMFAERVTEFEVDVDTNSYRLATRFAKFHNLPELTALLSSIADFHQVDEYVELPDFDGYTDTLVAKTLDFSKYLDGISERAEKVRAGVVSRKDDNMLKITTDGRKAALDLRLVDELALPTIESKVARCAENVLRIYESTREERLTQLVFCDTSTPKEGFNVYDDLKDRLVSLGIAEKDIAFVHDATTETKRAKLFDKVKTGDIRILLGSTFKLGMGVNVQDKLIAIHHLDVPWRPADMTQREGRILRQGNTNERVFIHRYITEGSFDAYSWQLLETKQRFISELLEGSLTERSGSDVENTVLSYAEVKALAIGNPLVKRRVETSNEITRLLSLHRKAIESHIALEKELLEMSGRINRQIELADRCLADVRWYRSNRRTYDKDERRELREKISETLRDVYENPAEDDVIAAEYQGFEIVVPKNISKARPYIWLQNEGRYYIELGESDSGALTRIDNFFDKFSEHLRRMNTDLADLRKKRTELRAEVEKKEDYTEHIERLRADLVNIDKELGVDKK